jgi:acetyl esterase/lipase
LHDEGAAYVERLRQAGAEVEYLNFDGLLHAFLNLEDLVPEQCAATYRRIGEFLQA